MELVAKKRDITQGLGTLRREGVLPAVIYGRDEASTPISLDRKTFDKVHRDAGETSVITVKGLGEDREVLIHDVSVHPVTGVTLHADLYAIKKGQTVTVSIPLEFTGTAPAVKDFGGVLVKVMHELEMEVLPKDLPEDIIVDISVLKTLDDKILVRDLKTPASAIITADPEEVVAMVTGVQEESEDAAPMDISQIGTSVERGKKEEEAAAE